jgi:hypothetical protein
MGEAKSTQSTKIAADSFHQECSPVHAWIVSIESDSAIILFHPKLVARDNPSRIAIASAIAGDATCGR